MFCRLTANLENNRERNHSNSTLRERKLRRHTKRQVTSRHLHISKCRTCSRTWCRRLRWTALRGPSRRSFPSAWSVLGCSCPLQNKQRSEVTSWHQDVIVTSGRTHRCQHDLDQVPCTKRKEQNSDVTSSSVAGHDRIKWRQRHLNLYWRQCGQVPRVTCETNNKVTQRDVTSGRIWWRQCDLC